MSKPIETLAGADIAIFRNAITPHVTAVMPGVAAGLAAAGDGDAGTEPEFFGVVPGGEVKRFTTNLFASRRTVDRDVLGGSEFAEWIDCLTSTGIERKIAVDALTAAFGQVIDPSKPPFNVKYDAQKVKPISLTNGSNLVVSGEAAFSAERDIGKIAAISNGTAQGPLLGYIGQVVNANQVRLFTDLSFTTPANAGSTRANEEMIWGTDCTAGLQAAFDAAEPTNRFDIGRVVAIGGMAMATSLRFGSISIVGMATTGCGFMCLPLSTAGTSPFFADKNTGTYATFKPDAYTLKNLTIFGQRYTNFYSSFRNAFEIRGGGFNNFQRGAPYARVDGIDVHHGQWNNIVTSGAFAGQMNNIGSYFAAQCGIRTGFWDLNGQNWHSEGNGGAGILSVMPGANLSIVRSSYNGASAGSIFTAGSFWPHEMGANYTECGFGNTVTNLRTQESWGHNICFSGTDPLNAANGNGSKNAIFLSTLDDTGNIVPGKGGSATRLPSFRAMVFCKGNTVVRNTVDLTTGSPQVQATNYATNGYADMGDPSANQITLRTPGISNAQASWFAGNGAVSPGPWGYASSSSIATRGNAVSVNGVLAP